MHNRIDDTLNSYEWDPAKETVNRAMHGVAFLDAVEVPADPLAVTVRDDSGEEVRHATLGLDGLGRFLVVVWTWRDERARMISARRATAAERATLRWDT